MPDSHILCKQGGKFKNDIMQDFTYRKYTARNCHTGIFAFFDQFSDMQSPTNNSRLIDFTIDEEVFEKALTENNELCPLPQTTYVAYRNGKLFNDPDLGENRTLASSVLLAQVGTADIQNLTNKVTATFLVDESFAITPVGLYYVITLKTSMIFSVHCIICKIVFLIWTSQSKNDPFG